MQPLQFRCLRGALAAVLAGAGLTITSARALDAQSDTESIRACYVPASGTMYRIQAPGAPSTCLKPSHVEFTLAALAPSAKASLAKTTPGGGGGNVTDHGTLGGLEDDDHSQYLLSDGVRTSTNGFAVTGTLGQGTIPASGYNVRLMWYPGKGAFRAGRPNSNSWDDPNVGRFSIAMGDLTSASGDDAVAIGRSSEADAPYALALQGGKATGYGAYAVHGEASGVGAVAIGGLSVASGSGAVAIGGNSTATAQNAFATGGRNEARGVNSVAMGSSSIASGFASAAIGWVAQSSGNQSIAIGSNVRATGDFSSAFGRNASTNGRRGSIIFGDASVLSASASAAADNQFVVRAQRFWFGSHNNVTATANRYIETSTGAYLSTGGVWVSSSDSTKKHRWAEVDGDSVLTALATLPIRTWSYRVEDDSVRHMGPTAQEFRSAFGLGDTDRAIASVDADGVALAAVKALDLRTRELHARVAELEDLAAELADLRAQVAALRAAGEAREQ